jgi:hypothetical protein
MRSCGKTEKLGCQTTYMSGNVLGRSSNKLVTFMAKLKAD